MSVKQEGIVSGRFCAVGDGSGVKRAKVLGRLNTNGVAIRFFDGYIETYINGNLKYWTKYQYDQIGGTLTNLLREAKK